jgi:hypothetical protein
MRIRNALAPSIFRPQEHRNSGVDRPSNGVDGGFLIGRVEPADLKIGGVCGRAEDTLGVDFQRPLIWGRNPHPNVGAVVESDEVDLPGQMEGNADEAKR